MTIKEIAELCGVDQSTVWRWAQKDSLLQNAKGIVEKLEQARKSGTEPADFTLEETLAIISDGGGNKTLAMLLSENAANKAVLAVRNRPSQRIYGLPVSRDKYLLPNTGNLLLSWILRHFQISSSADR